MAMDVGNAVQRQIGAERLKDNSLRLKGVKHAAYTGLLALRGKFTALGDPLEGLIVLPTRTLPAAPYRRCIQPPEPDPQLHLPGLTPCGCGDPDCKEVTRAEFARGHEAKRKSWLWKQARRGEEAAQELKRRKWELPPELRP
jgi:hypothetical protein